MNKLSLLEQAKSQTNTRKLSPDTITQEHIDLALAWVNGEVSKVQINKVLPTQKHHYGVYIFLSEALRQYIRNKEKPTQ